MLPRPCLLACLIAFTLAQPSHAAQRAATLAASSLAIETPCATQVDVSPDPVLQGRVVVDATADHEEELDRLALDTDRDTARIHTLPQGCWQPRFENGFQRTLRIAVRVPAGSSLDVDEGGAGRYVVGDVGGPMRMAISGSATLEVGRVATLTADLSGNGTIRLAAVEGAAKVDISGHGDVTLGVVAIPDLHIDISGAGSVAVLSGHVGTITVANSGAGSVRLDAPVTDASVDVSGLGSVRFASVTGTLHKTVSGLGSVTVGW